MSKIVERWMNGYWAKVYQADETVEVDHPSGRYRVIVCTPGDELSIEEAVRLGLVDKDGNPQTPPSKLRPAKDLTRHDVGPTVELERRLKKAGVL